MEWAQKTVRRVEGRADRSEHKPRSHLFLVMECSRPLAGGARYALDGVDEVALGRAPTRRISRDGRRLVVGVPDPLMSSTHARLASVGGGWAMRDAGSTNGTFVDGVRVDRAMLEDGALVELGGTLLTVRRGPTSDEAPRDLESGGFDQAGAVGPAGREADLGLATLVPSYAHALASLRQVIQSPVPILLLGETGTGKELLSRAVHALSGRPGAFVPVNCGAIPETLVESQLFGHVRGAFSGAVRDEPGLVRSSDRGTLFLDEVGDLPRASQAALLRVLQESEVQSIGATRPAKVDLRVVSATHRRIDALEEGGFRTDLYARLAGYVHELIPLRERREDLGILVAALLSSLAPERAGSLRLAPELGRALYRHPWPMNVRQLRHTLAAALVFAASGTIELAHVPEDVRAAPARRSPSHPVTAVPKETSAEDLKLRESLAHALTAHQGNVSEVARAMGRTRMQIHRWMRRFGIDPASYRPKG
jgi:DNA-binding NtrC family response regulator